VVVIDWTDRILRVAEAKVTKGGGGERKGKFTEHKGKI
jgi:hypothetical protein